MDRKKGHIHLDKRTPTTDKLYAKFAWPRSFRQNRKAFLRHSDSERALRNANREQLMHVRRAIMRRRLRNLLIALLIVLVLFVAAMLGLGYLLQKTSEAKEMLQTGIVLSV